MEARGHSQPELDQIPYHSRELRGHKVLVLAPHADDESLGCGGTLALHREYGDSVKVVILTDGAAGEACEKERLAYARLRESEARSACRELGLSDIEFWRIPDRNLSPDAATIDRLVTCLRDENPTLIYVPSPLEIHPDHTAAGEILWHALRGVDGGLQVAFYEVSRPIHVNTLVDISRVIHKKERACNAYKSQNAVRPYTEMALSLNRFRSLTLPSDTRFAEGFYLVDSATAAKDPVEFMVRRQLLPLSLQEKSCLPLVSLIIRTKDRPVLLKDALTSVFTQTYPNLEIILVNDGQDDVVGLVDEFGKHLRIVYVPEGTCRGRAAAANEGLRLARGKYVNFLDDDDVLYPRHVEKLVSYLEQSGRLFAYSDCEIGHYQSAPSGIKPIRNKTPFFGQDFDRDRLYLDNFLPSMTCMFRRSLCERVGPLDETLEVFEDWDFWIRMAQITEPQRVPGITAEYRLFAPPAYHASPGRAAIYKKYQDYWTPESLANRVWPHIHSLISRNDQMAVSLTEGRRRVKNAETIVGVLKARLREDQQRIEERDRALGAMENSLSWQIGQRIGRAFPKGLKRYLRRRLGLLPPD